jgi:hypothetical protein
VEENAVETPDSRPKLITVCLADIPPYVPPVYPKVYKEKGKLYVDIQEDRWYEVGETELRFLGQVHHFSKKTWVDGEFIQLLIERVAEAKGWNLRP